MIKDVKTSFSTRMIIDEFKKDIFDSNIRLPDNLLTRLFSAMVSKPFVILTGLSGSGKSKIAQAIVRWLVSANGVEKSLLLDVGETIVGNSENYTVVGVDSFCYQIELNGRIRAVPIGLVEEWVIFLTDRPEMAVGKSRPIREQLSKNSRFDKYEHGYDGMLLRIFNHIKQRDSGKQHMRTVQQYRFIPVGAGWSNNENLLGYANALDPKEYVMPDTGALELMLDANENPTKPFFLVLDEMNLSHVERYFADFLSVMESEEKIQLYKGSPRTANGRGIPQDMPWPKNLFIIGTVNIDETTYMFSPKVLDRAQVIEFRVAPDEMNAYLTNPSLEIKMEALAGKGVEFAEAFLAQAQKKDIKLPEGTVERLKAFFGPLAEVGAEFGYRTANEFLLFVGQYMELAKDTGLDVVVDYAVMQKLLPKLHGSKRKLRGPLNALWTLCLKDGAQTKLMDSKGINFKDICKHPVSAEKISRMYFNAEENGFTSYAEA